MIYVDTMLCSTPEEPCWQHGEAGGRQGAGLVLLEFSKWKGEERAVSGLQLPLGEGEQRRSMMALPVLLVWLSRGRRVGSVMGSSAFE